MSELWIAVTIGAAFAQSIRFMLQKKLRQRRLGTVAATFARFLYSAPLVALILLVYARQSGQPVPLPEPRFWAPAMIGGAAQILATLCVVALFSHRNFAVGITFKKTEVLLSALVGLVVLGEGVSPAGLAAMAVGFWGVVLLSDPPDRSGAEPFLRRIFNPAAGLGLASGVFFAVSGVGYRAASLSLPTGDALLRALLTLAVVTAAQVLAMAVWMGWRQRDQIVAVIAEWRVAALVGVTSMIGSIGWFTAFTLQNVAYVNAVGQVELIFSLLIGWLVFSERISRREWQGLLLLGLSILCIVLLR